jgi:hypothetical protein
MNGCSSIVFSDTTGAYSADNLNGYNAPNEDITSATAYLDITKPDNTIKRITLTGFPTIVTTKEFIITGEDLDYSDGIILDGLYTFEYVVTTLLGTVIRQIQTQGFYCNVDCCVKTMFLDINVDCNDCIKSIEQNSIKAFIMLQGLKYSLNCNKPTTFSNTLLQLNKLCTSSNCSSCK